jgi:cytochrome c oxidase subunit 2
MTPLGYLSGSGPFATPVVGLTWGLLMISIVVVIVTTALVIVGVWRGRVSVRSRPLREVALQQSPGGLRWIWIGVGVSSAALAASLVWTVAVLAAVNQPASPTPLTIRVTGEQWWWRAVYDPGAPARSFETANEVHIPVGQPVRIELLGGDVIHSFWVPQLAGKTDTIPGRTNVTFIQADRPGVYRGQCAEYCGLQHAHMAFTVVAEPPEAFAAWRAHQMAPAAAGRSDGEQLFVGRCGGCHAVRGVSAGKPDAPDLTHLMSRSTIASGAAPNTLASLSGWTANPQGVKPGALMPTLYLSGTELGAVAAYLVTLK